MGEPLRSLAVIYTNGVQQFVTFNAILSVLAQITKASLASPLAEIIGQLKWHWFSDMFKPQVVADFNIYDAACRGPYGAFVMLAKRRMWYAVFLLQPIFAWRSSMC